MELIKITICDGFQINSNEKNEGKTLWIQTPPSWAGGFQITAHTNKHSGAKLSVMTHPFNPHIKPSNNKSYPRLQNFA